MGSFCLKFSKIPRNMDILGVMNQYKDTHSTLESQFSSLYNDLKKMYSWMKIPIMARNTIRNRYMKILAVHRNDKKNPSPDYSQIMLEIFHVAKCNCYINVRAEESHCQCLPENRISDFGLRIYLDQLGARQFTFKCMCINNHLIKVTNEAEEEYTNDAIADTLIDSPSAHSLSKNEEAASTSHDTTSENTCAINELNDSLRSLSVKSTSFNDSGSATSDPEYHPTNAERACLIPEAPILVPQSLSEINFNGVIETADRIGISSEAAALFTNSIFEVTNWITDESKGLVVTKGFMAAKAEEKRKKTYEIGRLKRACDVENILGFSFDGKKNKNATRIMNPHGKSATKRVFKYMENVAIIKHPEVEPLGFISCNDGVAFSIFTELWKFLNPDEKEFKQLVAILSDGTNVNTGCLNGIIPLFENKIGRNLHWIICLLHLLELVLKYIIFAVDGKSLADNKLSGPLGKMISVNDFKVTKSVPFQQIPLGQIEAGAEKKIEFMRGDQRLLLDLGRAISLGECSDEIISRQPPPLSFCRWASAAIRLQLLYISEENPSIYLIALITFIQHVYIPMWIRVRLDSRWNKGSRHVFELLYSARKAAEMCGNKNLARVTQKVVLDNGYFAHSENILISMLTDTNPEVRKAAYARILKIRADCILAGEPYNMLRRFQKPELEDFDLNATQYYRMILDERMIFEPPLTQNWNQQKLEEMASENHLLIVPSFKCHSQDTERLVATMNKCVGRVPGIEAQNAILIHKLESRKRTDQIVKRDYKLFDPQNTLRWRKTDTKAIEKPKRKVSVSMKYKQ